MKKKKKFFLQRRENKKKMSGDKFHKEKPWEKCNYVCFFDEKKKSVTNLRSIHTFQVLESFRIYESV